MSRTHFIPLLFVPVVWLAPLPRVAAEPPKEDELAARVRQLEQRVAALEKALKVAKNPPATETEKKLVGNWAVAADGDRKVEGVVTDLRLNADGTGKAVVIPLDPPTP